MDDIQKNQSNKRFEKDLMMRLVRIETKMTRGFSEIGVDIDEEDWLEVDDENKNVYISTLGRALKIMIKAMQLKGATQKNQEYSIYYQDEIIGSIVYNQELLA